MVATGGVPEAGIITTASSLTAILLAPLTLLFQLMGTIAPTHQIRRGTAVLSSSVLNGLVQLLRLAFNIRELEVNDEGLAGPGVLLKDILLPVRKIAPHMSVPNGYHVSRAVSHLAKLILEKHRRHQIYLFISCPDGTVPLPQMSSFLSKLDPGSATLAEWYFSTLTRILLLTEGDWVCLLGSDRQVISFNAHGGVMLDDTLPDGNLTLVLLADGPTYVEVIARGGRQLVERLSAIIGCYPSNPLFQLSDPSTFTAGVGDIESLLLSFSVARWWLTVALSLILCIVSGVGALPNCKYSGEMTSLASILSLFFSVAYPAFLHYEADVFMLALGSLDCWARINDSWAAANGARFTPVLLTCIITAASSFVTVLNGVSQFSLSVVLHVMVVTTHLGGRGAYVCRGHADYVDHGWTTHASRWGSLISVGHNAAQFDPISVLEHTRIFGPIWSPIVDFTFSAMVVAVNIFFPTALLTPVILRALAWAENVFKRGRTHAGSLHAVPRGLMLVSAAGDICDDIAASHEGSKWCHWGTGVRIRAAFALVAGGPRVPGDTYGGRRGGLRPWIGVTGPFDESDNISSLVSAGYAFGPPEVASPHVWLMSDVVHLSGDKPSLWYHATYGCSSSSIAEYPTNAPLYEVSLSLVGGASPRGTRLALVTAGEVAVCPNLKAANPYNRGGAMVPFGDAKGKSPTGIPPATDRIHGPEQLELPSSANRTSSNAARHQSNSTRGASPCHADVLRRGRPVVTRGCAAIRSPTQIKY